MPTRTPADRDCGMVTAETAVVLPVLVLVLALATWAVGAAVAQLRLVDAASSGARAVARDEAVDQVRAAVLRAAPRGSSVRIDDDGDLVRVDVTVDLRAPGPLSRWLPSLPLSASASAVDEAAVLP